jgi:hypothetical protein
MDGQGTTSFIPKTRLTGPTYRPRPSLGLGLFISLILFLISLGLFAGTYLYRQSLQKNVNDDIASLELAKKSLEPNLLDELNRVSFSIKAAKDIINQHNTASQIFKIISDSTLHDVRFLNFNFTATDKNPVVTMNGEAGSYASIALEAQIFQKNKAVSQASFSNFSLGEGGRVDFTTSITLDPSFLIYKP